MNDTKRILVVDYQPDVRDVLQEMLLYAGFSVAMAGDGASARDALSVQGAIDLIILDPLIPGETPSAIINELNALDIPLLTISGTPEVIDFADQQRFQFLRKPFSTAELISAVTRTFGEYGPSQFPVDSEYRSSIEPSQSR